MDIEYEILIDLVAEGYLPVSEVSFFISPGVKKIIKDVPTVTHRDFETNMKPGDIVVAFSSKKQFIKTKHAKFAAKLMATAQGSPYTSSKMVIDNNRVAGYGIKVVDKPEDNKITIMPFKQFLSGRQELMLLRIKDITPDQINKAIAFIKKRVGLSYADSDLLKTAWNRFVNRKIFPFLKNRSLEPAEVSLIQEPLFCSNMISLALVSAGYKGKFNGKNPWDVWPRDFILSDLTEKIVRVDDN